LGLLYNCLDYSGTKLLIELDGYISSFYTTEPRRKTEKWKAFFSFTNNNNNNNKCVNNNNNKVTKNKNKNKIEQKQKDAVGDVWFTSMRTKAYINFHAGDADMVADRGNIEFTIYYVMLWECITYKFELISK